MSTTTMEVKAVSAATSSSSPSIKQTEKLAKLIDVSSCIGCKACEVACQEWNDLVADENRPFFGSYQTLPDLDANFWQLIKFNELEKDGRLIWNMTKYQCMHCADPGCLPEAAPNSVESEGRFRLSTILSHLSFGVHRNLVSEFGFQHPEVLVALDAPEVLLRLQEG